MGIAADAISDLIAPPRPDPTPPADASRDDGPSFADHLSATDNTRAPPENRSKQSSARDKADRPRDPTRSAPEQKSQRAAPDRAPQRAGAAKNTDAKTEPTDAQSAQAGQAAVAAAAQIKVAAPIVQNVAPSSLMQVLAHLVAQNQDAKAEPEASQEAAAQDVPADAKAAAQQQMLAVQLPAPQAAGKPQTKHASAGKTSAPNTKHASAGKTAVSPPGNNAKAAAVASAQLASAAVSPAAVQPEPAAPKAQAQPALDAAQMLAALTLPATQTTSTPTTTTQKPDLSIETDGTRAQTPAMPVLKLSEAPAPSAKTTQVKMAGALAAQQAAKQAFAVDAPSPEPSARNDAFSSSSALAAPQAPSQGSAVVTADAATRSVPVAAQVGREIIRRSATGSTRFEMRLDPPELGRVDVRLEISRDHRVTAVISADNPQALNELSRGARDLQQALQSAGLDLSDDGLSFDLSNQQNAFAQADTSNPQQRASSNTQTAAPLAEAAPLARPLSIDSWRGARVDVVA